MRLQLLAGALAVAAITACNDPVRAEDQLELTVGASRSTVALTDTVVLAAAVYNGSSSTLPVARPCGRPVQFEVLDAAGHVVLDSNGPDFSCAADTSATQLGLRAGQTLNSRLAIVGLTNDGSPLPAGTYALRATVIVAGTARRSPSVFLIVPASTT